MKLWHPDDPVRAAERIKELAEDSVEPLTQLGEGLFARTRLTYCILHLNEARLLEHLKAVRARHRAASGGVRYFTMNEYESAIRHLVRCWARLRDFPNRPDVIKLGGVERFEAAIPFLSHLAEQLDKAEELECKQSDVAADKVPGESGEA